MRAATPLAGRLLRRRRKLFDSLPRYKMDSAYEFIFHNFMKTCVIGKLTCNCKMIWLSICGLMLATNRYIFFYSFAKLCETFLFLFGL